MAHRLNERKLAIDHVLCSTAQRTRETASLMLPIMEISTDKLVFESSIYEASVNNLLRVVTSGYTGSVLLIGHNPGLEGLCDALCPGAVPGMPTCAVASFKLVGSDLAGGELTAPHAELVFYDFPKNR